MGQNRFLAELQGLKGRRSVFWEIAGIAAGAGLTAMPLEMREQFVCSCIYRGFRGIVLEERTCVAECP